MKHILKFSSLEHEKAWLIRVTENIGLDMLRHKKIRNYTPIEEIHSLEDTSKTDEKTDVFEKLAKLPSKYKSVIILYHLEGYSVEETSKILGISLSATKMRLKRGREALRNSLQKEDYDV
jgi:RNA polymerase sigma-70 factor (ECF subfamily)